MIFAKAKMDADCGQIKTPEHSRQRMFMTAMKAII